MDDDTEFSRASYSEEVTRFDLNQRNKIKVAAGGNLSAKKLLSKKLFIAKMECRINAKRSRSWIQTKSPGKIKIFHIPGGRGVRIDAQCVMPGYVISALTMNSMMQSFNCERDKSREEVSCE